MPTTTTLRRHRLTVLVLAGTALFAGARPSPAADAPAPDGWATAAPRAEIRPDFAYDPHGGPDGHGCLVITADGREGLAGCWHKTVAVTGGKPYRFTARYRATGVA